MNQPDVIPLYASSLANGVAPDFGIRNVYYPRKDKTPEEVERLKQKAQERRDRKAAKRAKTA